MTTHTNANIISLVFWLHCGSVRFLQTSRGVPKDLSFLCHLLGSPGKQEHWNKGEMQPGNGPRCTSPPPHLGKQTFAYQCMDYRLPFLRPRRCPVTHAGGPSASPASSQIPCNMRNWASGSSEPQGPALHSDSYLLSLKGGDSAL